MRRLGLTTYLVILAGLATACAGPEPAGTSAAARATEAEVAPPAGGLALPSASEATSTSTPAAMASTEAAAPPTEGETPPPEKRGLGSGTTAPELELTLFDGKAFRLSDLRGKVVILNFWGSWCPPCRKEMPSFQRIWEEYRERGVVIVGVAVLDTEEDARAFADKVGVTYPLGLDNTGQFVRSYRVTTFPTTFLIDREGNESRRINNIANEGVLRIFLRGLLQEG